MPYDPARAAEVLREVTPLRWPSDTPEALDMGAEALELLTFIADNCEVLHGLSGQPYDSIDDIRHARAEWEKERRA